MILVKALQQPAALIEDVRIPGAAIGLDGFDELFLGVDS
jgi:hypothetical protein